MCVKKNHKSVSVLMIEGLHYQVHQVQSATYLFTYSFIHSFIHSVSNHLLHRTNWTKTHKIFLSLSLCLNCCKHVDCIIIIITAIMIYYLLLYIISQQNDNTIYWMFSGGEILMYVWMYGHVNIFYMMKL